MDGVSGAGSVIAVVTIALQSTKVIYETFTGIHNGPIFLKQLTSELRTLQDVLASIADLSKNPTQAHPTKFQQLEDLSQRCVTDLQNMEEYLKSLSGGRRRMERVSNKLKTYLNTKRLEEFRARVQNHVHALTATLGVATLGDLGRLNSTLCTAVTSSEARADLLSKEFTRTYGTHVAGFSSLSEQNSSNHLSTMDAMGVHRQDLGRLQQDVEALGQTSASHMALSQQTASTAREDTEKMSLAITSMSGKLDSLSSISQIQYEMLQGMIKQLIPAQAPRELVIRHKDRRESTNLGTEKDETPTENIAENQNEPFGKLQEPSEHLSESISRLWSLASTKDATYHSEEAQDIIHDLGELISAALDNAKQTPPPTRNLKRSADYDQRNAESSHINERDLKRVRGLIAASPSLRVTKKAQPPRFRLTNSSTTIKNRSQTIQLPAGMMTVFSRIQKNGGFRSDSKRHFLPIRDDSEDDPLEIFASTVTFHPNDQSLGAKLRVAFLQRTMANGYFAVGPTLTFSCTIPEDSAIFKAVSNGDIEEMVRMFQENLAAVTDCDPRGRSLLSYALDAYQVQTGAFLLQHGADPNSRERGPNDDDDEWPMLFQGPVRYHYSDVFHDFPGLECMQHLLTAGADPTMELNRGLNYLTFLLIGDSIIYTEVLKHIIDSETFLFDLEQDLGDGSTPLLVASGTCGDIWPPTIRLLLRRGADIAARDCRGYTCLHMAFHSSRGCRHKSIPHDQLKACLILLVEAGADIHAIDNNNNSVSEFATGYGVWDSWEYALRACGKDAEQIKNETREKGWALPGDPDYEEYACDCESASESDSEYSELDASESDEGERYSEEGGRYSEEDGRYSQEGDFLYEISQPEVSDETDDFQNGSENDSDCSMGGVELSFDVF